MKVIIEHLDDELYEWCLLEYKHISKIVGKKNLVFTNVSHKMQKVMKKRSDEVFEGKQLELSERLEQSERVEQLNELGKVEEKSIKDLKAKFGKICLLDPKGEKMLTTEDGKMFDAFLFGGILGDSPMKGRTEKHFKDMGFERRNLGDKQMSTNTAVLVAHKIIDSGKRFEDLDFVNEIEIVLEDENGKTYSQILPYSYLVENDRPILPDGLIEHLQKEENE